MKKFSILGQDYEVIVLDDLSEDAPVEGAISYIDIYKKKIFFSTFIQEYNSHESFLKRVITHEILHAFMFESGLDMQTIDASTPWALNEEIIDWFAIQLPKINLVVRSIYYDYINKKLNVEKDKITECNQNIRRVNTLNEDEIKDLFGTRG